MDFRLIYFLVIAFFANLLAFILALVLTTQIIGSMASSTSLTQIADPTAFFVVALPVGIFHLRQAIRYAFSKNAFGVLKVYLYAWMVITLLAVVVAGGMFVSNLFKLLFSGVQPGRLDPALLRDLTSALVNIIIAGAVWLSHRRLAEGLPTAESPPEAKPE